MPYNEFKTHCKAVADFEGGQGAMPPPPKKKRIMVSASDVAVSAFTSVVSQNLSLNPPTYR